MYASFVPEKRTCTGMWDPYERRIHKWERAFDTYTDCVLPPDMLRLIVQHCDLASLCNFRRASRGCNAVGMALSVRSNLTHWNLWMCTTGTYYNYDLTRMKRTQQKVFVWECDALPGRMHVEWTDSRAHYTPDEYAAIADAVKMIQPPITNWFGATEQLIKGITTMYVPSTVDLSASMRAQAVVRSMLGGSNGSSERLLFAPESLATKVNDPRLTMGVDAEPTYTERSRMGRFEHFDVTVGNVEDIEAMIQ
jgi:hypothetical protein